MDNKKFSAIGAIGGTFFLNDNFNLIKDNKFQSLIQKILKKKVSTNKNVAKRNSEYEGSEDLC